MFDDIERAVWAALNRQVDWQILNGIGEGDQVYWQPVAGKLPIHFGRIAEEFEPGLFEVETANGLQLVEASKLRRVHAKCDAGDWIPEFQWRKAVI